MCKCVCGRCCWAGDLSGGQTFGVTRVHGGLADVVEAQVQHGDSLQTWEERGNTGSASAQQWTHMTTPGQHHGGTSVTPNCPFSAVTSYCWDNFRTLFLTDASSSVGWSPVAERVDVRLDLLQIYKINKKRFNKDNKLNWIISPCPEEGRQLKYYTITVWQTSPCGGGRAECKCTVPMLWCICRQGVCAV